MTKTPTPSRITREFGKRLRACRVAAGFEDAEAFAETLGIESPRYRRYERGEAEPSYELLIDIARYVNKPIEFLLTGRMPALAASTASSSSD